MLRTCVFICLAQLRKLLDHLGLRMEELQHLQHEMPVPPGTEVTEEIKAEYCPWWYMPGIST